MEKPANTAPVSPPVASNPPPAATRPAKSHRGPILLVGFVLIVLAGWYFRGTLVLMFTTVSTDDAYVHGHVTYVAARVPGQVIRVRVDDNNVVKRGDVLIELDPTPYQVALNLRTAEVEVAEAEVSAAHASVRATIAAARGHFYELQNSLQRAQSEIEGLSSDVAQLDQNKATLGVAETEYQRVERITRENPGAASQKELDLRRGAFLEAQAAVRSALQAVRQRRATMGIPVDVPEGKPLDSVPANWSQGYPPVRTALAAWVLDRAQIGLPLESFSETPDDVVKRVRELETSGDLDGRVEELVESAPTVRVARARLDTARRNLDNAQLDLSYTTIVAEIDGVVARRNVNPGNYAHTGESLMAVRSSTQIWINANFKETQLSDIRIGLPVDIYVDAYGSKQRFAGRVTGFSAGTGSTLAILPAENATGNFVKVVQRLPVRIELTEPPPPDMPFFIGLSVEPYVRIKETPTGPNAGQMLQAAMQLPTSRPGAPTH